MNCVRVTSIALIIAVGSLLSGCLFTRGPSVLEVKPLSTPWEMLPKMPNKNVGFRLAHNGKRIYKLGGCSFDIRAGQAYPKTFSEYNPETHQWKPLSSPNFGTGSAFLEYWPSKKSFVAIAGGEKLGQLRVNGAKVGIYSLSKQSWNEPNYIKYEGLLRIACFTHLEGDRFLILAHDKIAVLDLSTDSIKVIGTYPVTGRTQGWAKADGKLYVLQGESRKPSQFHVFDLLSVKYLKSVETSETCLWSDIILSWENHLLIWKNTKPEGRYSYTVNSRLMRIDKETGEFSDLFPEFPGPKSRASGDAIMFKDSMFVFGGKMHKVGIFDDAYQFHFRLRDKHFKVK